MDGRRFDGIVRGMASGTSRRRVLKGFASAVAGIGLSKAAPGNASVAAVDVCRSDADCPLGTCDLASPVRYVGGCDHSTTSCDATLGIAADCRGGSGFCDQSVHVPGVSDDAACRAALSNPEAYRHPGGEAICYQPIYVGTCAASACSGPGEACSRTGECCEGVCYHGTCRNDEGDGCQYGAQCTTGYCAAVGGGPCVPSQGGCSCAEPAADSARVTVRYHGCPEGAQDLATECVGSPLAGIAVALSNGATSVTDDLGHVAFTVTEAGVWTIGDDHQGEPLAVLCALSDPARAETFLNDGTSLSIPEIDVDVICDVYYASGAA